MSSATWSSPGTPSPGPHESDGPEDAQLGPLAKLFGQSFVVGTLIHAFAVLFDRLPSTTVAPLLGLAVLCVVLAPKSLSRGMRVSLPVLLLLSWMVLSWVWSVDPSGTASRLWTVVPSLLAMIAITGVLPDTSLYAAVRWSIRLTLLLVVAALITSPTARFSGDEQFFVAGWRGTFPDKNSLALYLVFALSATLSLDRGISRPITCAIIAVLLGGSQSATGLSAAVLVVALWAWLRFLQRRGGRQSAIFVLSTVGVSLLAFGAFLVNFTRILEIYGRDASLSGRTDIWAAVVHAVEVRPMTGYGLGALLNLGSPSTVTLDLWREIGFRAVHAHNGVLDLLGQLGAIGLGLYLLAMGTTLTAAVRHLRDGSREATFALTTVSAQLVMSVSENVFLGPWLFVLLLVQAGLLRKQTRPADSAGSHTLVVN